MNPEQKIIKIKNDFPLINHNLSDFQKEYLELMASSEYSIKSLCEYYYKTGQIVNFSEIWHLLLILDKEKILIEPQITEWQPSDLNNKINTLAINHAGYLEKMKPEELGSLPFFRNLNAKVINFLANLSSVYRVENGTQLCQQGKNDRSLFVILDGQASIYRNINNTQRMLLVRVEKGAIIGETAFFLGEKRSADVIMSKAGKIIKINFDPKLNEIIKTDIAQALKDRFWFMHALIKSPLFKNLPETSFDALLHTGKTVSLREGEVLFHEGDNSDCFYIIIQGSILISQRGHNINVLTPGDSLGEIAFLKINEKRTATVTAQSFSLLMCIPHIKLTQLIFNNLSLGIILEKIGFERLERDNKRQTG
jgi:CRP-like cAMP-binding protein